MNFAASGEERKELSASKRRSSLPGVLDLAALFSWGEILVGVSIVDDVEAMAEAPLCCRPEAAVDRGGVE